jgi:hypothetical protein
MKVVIMVLVRRAWQPYRLHYLKAKSTVEPVRNYYGRDMKEAMITDLAAKADGRQLGC